MNKAEAREYCRQVWKSFLLAGETKRLFKYLTYFFDKLPRNTRLLIFLPLRDEIDYLHLLQDSNLHLYAPRMTQSGMEFYRYNPKRPAYSQLERGYRGILQPKASADSLQFPLLAQDWILLPSLGVRCDGVRLGRGGGYYDRWREKLSHLKRITLLPSELTQLVFPIEEHDISVTDVSYGKGNLTI